MLESATNPILAANSRAQLTFVALVETVSGSPPTGSRTLWGQPKGASLPQQLHFRKLCPASAIHFLPALHKHLHTVHKYQCPFCFKELLL